MQRGACDNYRSVGTIKLVGFIEILHLYDPVNCNTKPISSTYNLRRTKIEKQLRCC